MLFHEFTIADAYSNSQNGPPCCFVNHCIVFGAQRILHTADRCSHALAYPLRWSGSPVGAETDDEQACK